MKNSHLGKLIDKLQFKKVEPLSIDNMLILLQGLASLKMDAAMALCEQHPSLQKALENVRSF